MAEAASVYPLVHASLSSGRFLTEDDDDTDDFDIIDFVEDEGEYRDLPTGRRDNEVRKHFRRRIHLHQPKPSEMMKAKMSEFWNSIKYGGWTAKPKISKFSKKRQIFLLGRPYDLRHAESEEEQHLILAQFRHDFTSRLWFSYRSGFCELTDTRLTSDGGWGCMLRSAQMMLAQGLVMHFLGRDWRLEVSRDIFSPKSSNASSQPPEHKSTMHREILRWFADRPSAQSPFSIHRLVSLGKSLNKQAGDWYGPSSASTILEKACPLANEFVPLLRQVCIYVAQDCTLYVPDVISVATSGGRNPWKACLILIPVRLGGSLLNSDYIPCLKALFAHEMFLGIMGGRPKHSLYFIGFQGEKFIHLDPHVIQDTVDVSVRDFPTHSYHNGYPHRTPVRDMDPSCAFGFYCRTQTDFQLFLRTVPALITPPTQHVSYPIFTIKESAQKEMRLFV